MKKQAALVVAKPQPRPARTLFGLSNEELSTVHGGGGVIINNPKPSSSGGTAP